MGFLGCSVVWRGCGWFGGVVTGLVDGCNVWGGDLWGLWVCDLVLVERFDLWGCGWQWF